MAMIRCGAGNAYGLPDSYAISDPNTTTSETLSFGTFVKEQGQQPIFTATKKCRVLAGVMMVGTGGTASLAVTPSGDYTLRETVENTTNQQIYWYDLDAGATLTLSASGISTIQFYTAMICGFEI